MCLCFGFNYYLFPLIILVLVGVFYILKSRKRSESKSNKTSIGNFPLHQSDINWAVNKLNGNKKYSEFLNKHVREIKYSDTFWKGTSTNSVFYNGVITLHKPVWNYINNYPHRGEIFCSILGHELGHPVTNNAHSKEFDDWYRAFCRNMNVPYLEYVR